MSTVPKTVDPTHAPLYADANEIRQDIKYIAGKLSHLRIRAINACFAESEAVANTTLAYRHLEDASMRLGKMLQALDGGVSVYDAKTTVGAPEPFIRATEDHPAIDRDESRLVVRPINRDAEGAAIHADGHGEGE